MSSSSSNTPAVAAVDPVAVTELKGYVVSGDPNAALKLRIKNKEKLEDVAELGLLAPKHEREWMNASYVDGLAQYWTDTLKFNSCNQIRNHEGTLVNYSFDYVGGGVGDKFILSGSKMSEDKKTGKVKVQVSAVKSTQVCDYSSYALDVAREVIESYKTLTKQFIADGKLIVDNPKFNVSIQTHYSKKRTDGKANLPLTEPIFWFIGVFDKQGKSAYYNTRWLDDTQTTYIEMADGTGKKLPKAITLTPKTLEDVITDGTEASVFNTSLGSSSIHGFGISFKPEIIRCHYKTAPVDPDAAYAKTLGEEDMEAFREWKKRKADEKAIAEGRPVKKAKVDVEQQHDLSDVESDHE